MSYHAIRRDHTEYNQRGFTVVELLLIIITVGAITGLIITTFTDLGRKRQNSERQQDITTLQRALENYYSQQEKYPTLAQLNDRAWRTKNLKSISDDVLVDPANSVPVLVSAPAAKSYSYAPTTTDGGSCDNSTNDCMKYVLTATQQDESPFVKNNYN